MNKFSDFITSNEVLNILLGSFITFFSGLLLFVFQLIINLYLKNRGKFSIFYKHVHSKVSTKPIRILKEDKSGIMEIPLWVEFHNTKDKPQIIRDLNLEFYCHSNFIGNSIQVNEYGDERTKIANEGSYSFLVEAKSISQFEVYFIFREKDKFNKIEMTFYDINNNKKSYTFLSLEDGWETKVFDVDNKWHRLN